MKFVVRRRGFTLIELLVVIAIIAILAAILFPVFVKARQNANTAKDQSHQKQLVSALMLYVDDYNGKLPRAQFLTDGAVGGVYLNLYRPYVKNFNILRCSGAPYRNPSTGLMTKPAFAYNESCLCVPLDKMKKSNDVSVSDLYEIDIAKAGSFPNWPGRPLADVANPRNTPAFFCSESYHTSRYTHERYGYGWQAEDIKSSARMINPHAGGANYAFLDGHVQWLRPNGMTRGVMLYMATKGIDYDGNGTVGDSDWMR